MMMTSYSRSELAIEGGEPVFVSKWPIWPSFDKNTEQALISVLHSGRWAISGYYTGKQSFERRFAKAFADFHGVSYCVPVSNGSSALSVAIEALGIGHGDEVLVPGLTWVACASAVVASGGTPVLVDIDPATLCMSVAEAEKAITAKTKAIMLVHLYCTVGDLDAFIALSRKMHIPLIEDCSQAHGASWRSKLVGTHGIVGTFSMQQSKVLTSGEGGAVITNDPELYRLMQQVRADGRLFLETAPDAGFMELEEVGDIQGRNYCMSEFHAAILIDRLAHLKEENDVRRQNGEFLGDLLEKRGLAKLSHKPEQVDSRTFYQFCVRLNCEAFENRNSEAVARTLTPEIGALVEPVDRPLNQNKLYNPLKSKWISQTQKDSDAYNPMRFTLPNAEKAREECLTIPHHVLLSDEKSMRCIANAFDKVSRLSKHIPV